MDKIDRKILQTLQDDARITMTELSQRVGLSKTPCLERVRRLEAGGVICGYHARLDPEKLDALGTVSSMTALLDEFVQAGATKFILRAACPPEMMTEQLQVLIDEVIPKYHG